MRHVRRGVRATQPAGRAQRGAARRRAELHLRTGERRVHAGTPGGVRALYKSGILCTETSFPEACSNRS